MMTSGAEIHKVHNKMSGKLLLTYNDNSINYNTVSDLLTKLWTTLEENDVSISNIKKIYSITTECLENIHKHSDLSKESNSIEFSIYLAKDKLEIVCKNPLKSSRISQIEERINFLKSLNKIGLKKLYQYEIKKRGISNKGGAGLGLIIIARKSDSITCFSEKLNDKHSTLTLKIKVSL